jgi:hypothetical protein
MLKRKVLVNSVLSVENPTAILFGALMRMLPVRLDVDIGDSGSITSLLTECGGSGSNIVQPLFFCGRRAAEEEA